MTAMTTAAHTMHSNARRRGRDWGAAAAALRALASNKEDTSQVYAVMRALNGHAYEAGYIRLLDSPVGGRIAYDRAELAEQLMDEAWRASFPPGSVGAAFNDWHRREHLSMQGLLDESHKGIPPEELDQDHPYMWFFRRFRDIHDILHVLTGYGRDSLGEICLLMFSYEETHDLGRAVIAMGSYLRAHGPAAGQARKAIREAIRRGREAAWLPGEDFEKLLLEPLDDARRRLGLTPPVAYAAVPADLRNLTLDS
jgi:ubiquinone biosynthesis protein COQ4